MSMDAAAERAWMEQWRSAARALEDQRKEELRALSDADALAASDALLSLALLVPLNPDRVGDSGLVRQQELFHGGPR